MKHRLRLGLVAGALLVSGLGVTAFDAAPAHAALTCTGSGCNGKDPMLYGCNATAHTVNSTTWSDGAAGTLATQTVQLRYSTKCKASWSRVIVTVKGTAHVTYSYAYMDPYKSATKRTIYNAGSVYSKMRSGSSVNACGTTNFNNGAVVQTHCTSAG